MIYLVFTVDMNGVLNAATLDLINGWHGPDPIGNAVFPTGARISAFKLSTNIYTALLVDQNGALNVVSLDPTKGWQGPDTVGNAIYSARVADNGVSIRSCYVYRPDG